MNVIKRLLHVHCRPLWRLFRVCQKNPPLESAQHAQCKEESEHVGAATKLDVHAVSADSAFFHPESHQTAMTISRPHGQVARATLSTLAKLLNMSCITELLAPSHQTETTV